MRISQVQIRNFRNFKDLTVETSRNLLLVGANATGKSNFIHALRLVFDGTLSRRDRMLTGDDFWRGADLEPWQGRKVEISVRVTDFENEAGLRSFLCDYITDEEGVATLNYVYKPKGNVHPDKAQEMDYEFRLYGGNDESNEVGQLLKYLNLRVVGALRDAHVELIGRRVPLRHLMELYGVNSDSVKDALIHLNAANKLIQNTQAVQELESDILARLHDIREYIHELEPVLRLAANKPHDIVL